MKHENDIYALILAVLTGEATDEERHVLEAWLAESEENRRQFEQVEHLYRLAHARHQVTDEAYDIERAWQQVRRQTVGKKQVWMRWLSYAAAVAILVAVGFVWWKPATPERMAKVDEQNLDQPVLMLENGKQIPLKQDSFSIQHGNTLIQNNSQNQLSYKKIEKKSASKTEEITWNRLVIPKGNAYELELADGTHVWLNAESELTYPTRFPNDIREVKLKGEAYFDVAKNPEKPFRVLTNEIEVKVLGTSFNVSAYESERFTSVTLVGGSVAVQTDKGEHFRIVPSEQFTHDGQSHQSTIKKVDTDLYTSWTRGEYIFKDATLEDIFDKLSHWYDFTVKYQHDQLRGKRFSLVVDRKISLNQLLELISFTSDVQLEQYQGNIIVKRKGEEVQ